MKKFVFFILINLQILINAENDPYPNGNLNNETPGVSSCKYIGDNKYNGCKKTPMSIKKLPKECTSFFYDGLLVSPQGDKIDLRHEYNKENRIEDLCNTQKNVYLHYGYDHLIEWITALDTEGQIEKEINTFKDKYFNKYPIKGLVLERIDLIDELTLTESFTSKLIKYITTYKEKIPNLQIAIRLIATSMQKYVENNCENWLDFQALNEVVNFYTIGFKGFNECSEDFIHTGIIPLDGPGNTLKKFLNTLNSMQLPKDKVYFEFLVSPTQAPGYGSLQVNRYYKTLRPCFVRYTKICEHDYTGIEKWCADTSVTLREKGNYARQNGAGFIAHSIDAIDRNVKCECYNSKYPAFFFMLDGWHCINYDKKCPKFDRQFD